MQPTEYLAQLTDSMRFDRLDEYDEPIHVLRAFYDIGVIDQLIYLSWIGYLFDGYSKLTGVAREVFYDDYFSIPCPVETASSEPD